jgi:hypothetical protein
MGRLSLGRERRRVRVHGRLQARRDAKPLTLVLSPSGRGEAGKSVSLFRETNS